MANQPSKYSKFLVGAASAALVASAVAPVASAADFSDVKGNTHEDAINSLVKAGVISGYPDGSFLPNKTLTRSDVVKMMGKLLVSLGNEVPTDYKTNPRFTDQTSKTNDELLQASALVKDHGVFNGLENGSLDAAGDITRENMAIVLVRAYDAINKTDLVAYVKEQEFKKDVTDLATAKAEARPYIDVLDFFDITNPVNPTFNPKDTTTRGQFASFLFKTTAVESPAEKVTTATKVESVTATNLKEVTVTFDGTVDKSTASEVANYTITGAKSPVVESVLVSEDAKSVTLILVGEFENQSQYKLSVNNIKAGDKVLNDKDIAFKPLDNTVPTVSKVEALGNKTVRVSFSEPIKTAQTSHFEIDGKVVVGSIQTTGNSVILKLSSSLTDGEHTISAEGIQDYNNFKVIKAETKFNVVEDKEAPTVAAVVSASFEKVVLKFSEPVEQVFASNVYWMQGASKKQASSVKALADDTYEFTFVDTNKLVYTTDLFVTNVKDYSGNVIAKETKVEVSPVIDQTRPEVISSAFVKDTDNKKIVLKFTKSLDTATAGKAANYVIKDKDGKTQAISTSVDTTKAKEVTITLLSALKDNSEYTLTVNGVSDDTTLKNVMLPYTTTLNVKDVTPPTFESVTRLNDKQLYVEFSEAMATSGDGSVVDASKYVITAGTKTITPSSFNVTGDSKGVILTFSDDLPAFGSISMKVQLVKDLAGNYLANLTSTKTAIDKTSTLVDKVTAVATDKVEVTFTKALQSLNQADFTVEGHEIAYSELSANGKTATFTLKTKLPENVMNATPAKLQLTVVPTPSSVDILGSKIGQGTAKDITDEIKATVKSIVASDLVGDKIKITFNEAVTATSAITDFVVKNHLGEAVTITDVSATSSTDLIITLDEVLTSATVSAKDVRFVKDAAGNTIADIDATTVELGDKVAPVAPTVSPVTPAAVTVTGTAEAGSTVTVKEGTTVLGTAKATAGGTFSVAIAAQTAGKVLTVTATDAAGNVSTAATVTVAP